MKTFFTFILLTIASTSMAKAACYVTDDNWSQLPQEICLNDMQVNLDTEVLTINETNGVFPQSLPTNYLARRNENGYSFRTSHLLVDSWPGGCESGVTIVLNINGKTDNDGVVDYIELSADYKHAHDSCHSREREGRAIYKLKN